jgi:hypothetical protein
MITLNVFFVDMILRTLQIYLSNYKTEGLKTKGQVAGAGLDATNPEPLR